MKIHPIDRERYLLAGSVIKSAYNVRDCADVDFFVLDHEDNIEKYSRYNPQVGIPGIFDDFGKTYYGNEEFYFPMIPEMYEKQRELKERRREEDVLGQVPKEIKMILNNYPKYSASGLKAGRYVDIFSAECRKIGYDIMNLDELVSNPDNRIYFLGCPVIPLKIEMVRDGIKDIDLGRVSLKQMHDFHFLSHHCAYLFSTSEMMEFGFSHLESRDKIKKPKIRLTLNCYHKELDSTEKVGYDLVIRRSPLYLEKIVVQLILEGPLLISRENETIESDSRLVYQRPLLSSLPQSMETLDRRKVDVSYYYEISDQGQIKIFVCQMGMEAPEISFFENICVAGTLKVEKNEGTKKIGISILTNGKMRKIFSQITSTERKKEYRNMLINFVKNIIQIHKMVDCHTTEKLSIDKV